LILEFNLYLCAMTDFRIEGWFPPGIVNTLSGRYACCGSNWVKITEDMTMQEVMKGWVCTAPAWEPKVEKPKLRKLQRDNLLKLLVYDKTYSS